MIGGRTVEQLVRPDGRAGDTGGPDEAGGQVMTLAPHHGDPDAEQRTEREKASADAAAKVAAAAEAAKAAAAPAETPAA